MENNAAGTALERSLRALNGKLLDRLRAAEAAVEQEKRARGEAEARVQRAEKAAAEAADKAGEAARRAEAALDKVRELERVAEEVGRERAGAVTYAGAQESKKTGCWDVVMAWVRGAVGGEAEPLLH